MADARSMWCTSPRAVSISLVVGLLLCATCWATEPSQRVSAETEVSPLRIESEVQLISPYARSVGVRWSEGGERAYVAVVQVGVLEFDPRTGRQTGLIVAADQGAGSDSVFAACHVAASSGNLAVAAAAWDLAWTPLGSSSLGRSGLPFDAIESIDLHAGRLAWFGLLRGEDGVAADGAVAWVGSIDERLADYKPIYYSPSGPGADTVEGCVAFAVARVRFLADGSLLLHPGTEPGLYQYDPSGTLQRIWQTAPMGLDLDCDLDEEAENRFGTDEMMRRDWINGHRLIDDILPLPAGPGLILRDMKGAGQGPVWTLALLGASGIEREIPIPISSPSDYAHLAADAHGDQIVFLLREYFEDAPSELPKLFVASFEDSRSTGVPPADARRTEP